MQAPEQTINEDSVSLFICAYTRHSIVVHKGFLMLIYALEMNTFIDAWILGFYRWKKMRKQLKSFMHTHTHC